MSSIPTKQIDGDVAVGRNVSAGGDANIQGNARVGHDLIVEGWLEAKNIKGVNKGLFASAAALREAYPQPHDGWFAGVSASEADITALGLTVQQGKALFRMYVGSGGDWVCEPINKLYEIVVDNVQVNNLREDLSTLQGKHEALEKRVDAHDTEISGIKTQQTTLGNTVNNNTSSINTLKGRVDGHDTSIAKNAADIKAINDSKGAAGGIAPLNESGRIPARFIPGAMDDVKEFDGFVSNVTVQAISIVGNVSVMFNSTTGCFIGANLRTLHLQYANNWDSADGYGEVSLNGRIPEKDKVYVDRTTNKTYRWSGSQMVVIGSDLALGETSSTAFPGDRGARLETQLDDALTDINRLYTEFDSRTQDIGILPFDGVWDGTTTAPRFGVWFCPNDENGAGFRTFGGSDFYGLPEEYYNSDSQGNIGQIYRCDDMLYRIISKLAISSL